MFIPRNAVFPMWFETFFHFAQRISPIQFSTTKAALLGPTFLQILALVMDPGRQYDHIIFCKDTFFHIRSFELLSLLPFFISFGNLQTAQWNIVIVPLLQLVSVYWDHLNGFQCPNSLLKAEDYF